MAATILVNSVAGSNDNVTLGVLVNLDSQDTATTYLWSILSQPAGAPADVLSSTTDKSPTFTPTREGSYLIQLVVDQGLPTEDTDQVIVAVLELETGNRIPAVGETTQNDASTGWAQTAVDEILRRVTRLTDGGYIMGVASESIPNGSPVYGSGTTTIATGLPGERPLIEFSRAYANDAATLVGNMGMAIESVDGSPIVNGSIIRVLLNGLFQSVLYVGSPPAIGDWVYITDAGSLSTTAGTYGRTIGSVCNVDVGTSTYDVFIGGEMAVPFGPAGGDLTGLYPNPDIAKLQGQDLDVASTPPASGEVLGWDGSAWVPVSNGSSPVGAAGGVLGYTGSTYPDPNGLSANGSGLIPILPNGGATFKVDNVVGTAQDRTITLQAGDASAVGAIGGYSGLVAGYSAAGTGGDAFIIGGAGEIGGGAGIEGGQGENGAGGLARLAGGSGTTVGGAAVVEAGDASGGTGGAGGAVTVSAGDGDGVGVGGQTTVSGGNGATGGAAAIAGGVGTAGVGGASSLTGGNGTSNGGASTVKGGNSTGVGIGGLAKLVGGNGTNGGNAQVTSGYGSTTSGDVRIATEGSGSNADGWLDITLSGVSNDASNFTLNGGEANGVGYSGTNVTFNLGSVLGGATAGVFTVVSGSGAPASLSNAATSGGDITLTAGTGGNASSALDGGFGGFVTIQGGTGGAGTITKDAGDGSTVYIYGGSAGTSAKIGGGADGGDVFIRAGGGSGTGTAGDVVIGSATTSNVYLGGGSADSKVITQAIVVQTPSSLTPTTGGTITPLRGVVILTPASAVTGVVMAAGTDGQRVTFIGGNTNSTQFSRSVGNRLALTNASHTISQYDTLELVYSTTLGVWCQVSEAQNAV